MKNCPHCKTEVQDAAVICKNCKQSVIVEPVKKKSKLFYGLIFISWLFVLYFAWWIAVPACLVWYVLAKSKWHELLKIAAVIVIIFLILPLFWVNDFFDQTPRLQHITPSDTVDGATTTIRALVRPKGALVAFNGQTVPTAADGFISQDVALPKIENVFSFVVNNKKVSRTEQVTVTRNKNAVEIAADKKAQAVEDAKAKVLEAAWNNSRAGRLCKAHSDWGRDDCTNVANGKVWVGMTYDMLIASMGSKPDVANPSNYGGATHWQYCWTYRSMSCFYDSNGDGVIDAYN